MSTYSFKLISVSIAFLLLSGCMPEYKPTGTSTIQMEKPLLTFREPPKQALMPVEWDFPRRADRVSIKNSKVCIAKAKAQGLKPANTYPVKDVRAECAVPAVDQASNLYIGLSESNYRNLVNNYNVLVLREEQWQFLLKNINDYLKSRNESNSKPKSSNSPSSTKPK